MQGGFPYTFKQEFLQGLHDINHTFKIALIGAASTSTPETCTSYTDLNGELADGNGYTTGGKALTGAATGRTGATSWIDFADVSWAGASFSAAARALVYLPAILC